ncbi:hypothetical protein [Micromonospora sp. BL4]|uniref:hypothetical protein n=1 Tax=Micromonospora sp. BL4 TaxID=2478710 RepID=UPI0011C405E4|nr:hypothetical protein [Micromonospora sp. BL4]
MPRGKKAANVEATLLVEDEGAFSAEPIPEIGTGPIKVSKSEYGDGYTAKFEVMNQMAAPLKSPRVDVVCYDNAKKIIGGAFAFPDLIPPSDKAVTEVDLLVATKPTSCVAYASPSALMD